MLKKRSVIVSLTVAVLLTGAILATQISKPGDDQLASTASNSTTRTEPTAPESTQSETTAPVARGRYITYTEQDRSDTSYSKTILFFHAPWCPQCRAFEKSITAGEIPDGIQILKVDYDSNQALKKQYGVTLQTSFISVQPGGTQIKKWVGYTSDHTLDSLLNEFST